MKQSSARHKPRTYILPPSSINSRTLRKFLINRRAHPQLARIKRIERGCLYSTVAMATIKGAPRSETPEGGGGRGGEPLYRATLLHITHIHSAQGPCEPENTSVRPHSGFLHWLPRPPPPPFIRSLSLTLSFASLLVPSLLSSREVRYFWPKNGTRRRLSRLELDTRVLGYGFFYGIMVGEKGIGDFCELKVASSNFYCHWFSKNFYRKNVQSWFTVINLILFSNFNLLTLIGFAKKKGTFYNRYRIRL